MEDLSNTVNSLGVIDIYRTFHPATAEYSLFVSAHGTVPKVNFIMGHKKNLKIFKEMEIKQSMLSDHKGIELEISNRKISGTSPNILKLNNTLLK